MNEKLNMSMDQLKAMPPSQLIELSHAELDHYILEAEKISIDAAIVLNWLTYVKNEKTLAEKTYGQNDGGVNV